MKYLWIAAVLLAVIFVSCDEDTPPPPPVPTMTIMEAPRFLAANVDSCYTYRVQLENVDAESVTVEVRTPDGNVHSSFALYDDGSLLPAAPPDYACSHSGDIWANDGQYTRRINAQLLADSVVGNYTFTFRAPEVPEQARTVAIQVVEPCLITSFTQMADLPECFSPATLEVRVSRTEGDLVDSVIAQFHVQGHTARYLEVFEAVAGDSIWQSTLTPSAFRCLFSDASYTAEYQAWTRFGMHCEQTTEAFSFTNSLPSLSNSTLPDTIFRPTAPGSVDSTSFTVNLQDCELVGEPSYDGVKYSIRRRDRTEWTDSSAYVFRDDGISPDVVAGNGVFTTGLSISFNTPDSLYYFRFYAIECAAPYDTSAFLIDSVQIWPQPGIASGRRGQNATRPTGAFPLVFQ